MEVKPEQFKKACLDLHKQLRSPVMMFFACDDRAKEGVFTLRAVFKDAAARQWVVVSQKVPALNPAFESIAREIYSANLFEREIEEMFGIVPTGNPDARRLRLHEEVWPEGFYPLRKDFDPAKAGGGKGSYVFNKVEGEGLFEVPVGPVHAGIIGPGHFRFSAAGEPIIDLDIRLGFTHRGAEKLLERKYPAEAVKLTECVAGDTAFAHSLAFCRAAEKIAGMEIPQRATDLRSLFLELERMHNHIASIGGIALDVGFSAASAYASIIKESLHQLNGRLTGHRFLKGVNIVGGVTKDLDEAKVADIRKGLVALGKDFFDLKVMLMESVSFMDRVETTGVLKKRIAEDLGVVGVAARASRIGQGDVLARLKVRLEEFEGSLKLIGSLLEKLPAGEIAAPAGKKEGGAIGEAEGARGPVLYWLSLDGFGAIKRCKIVDPSFHNWPGLAYAVPGEILPDFPVCNKSFDLSYPGNDL